MTDETETTTKSGRRNSASDVALLEKIQALIAELLASEQAEENTGEEKSSALNLSYVKSLGVTIPDSAIAVKSIGADEIQGYTNIWGNPDRVDIEREYFTKQTNFWDNILGKSPRPLTWDHAQDDTLKASPVIGQMVDFGDDEIGRWYVAKLDRAHKYRQAVDALIVAGKLGTSSDSAPQYVERVKTGKSTWLKTWPLFAAALTETPAEPRMIGSIEYFKSIGVVMPDNSAVSWRWLTARMKKLSFYSK